MGKLHLLSLCLICLGTPALAQVSLSLPPSDGAPVPAASEQNAPDQGVSDDMSASDDTSEEPVTPAMPSKDALAAFLKTCTDVSGGDPAAYDRANAEGWVPDDTSDSGPYRRIYSASKDFDGYGSVTLWGSVDTYPSQMLGYCRVDFGDYNNDINLDDINGMQGLNGTTTTPDSDGNVFGAWESADKKLLVIADRTDGQVEVEFNLLLGDKK